MQLTDSFVDAIRRGRQVCEMAGQLGSVAAAAAQLRQQPGACDLPASALQMQHPRRTAGPCMHAQLWPALPHPTPSCRHTQEGYPSSMYGMSKLAEAAYTRVLARELEPRHIMVNAVCPGVCAPCPSSQLPFAPCHARAQRLPPCPCPCPCPWCCAHCCRLVLHRHEQLEGAAVGAAGRRHPRLAGLPARGAVCHRQVLLRPQGGALLSPA